MSVLWLFRGIFAEKWEENFLFSLLFSLFQLRKYTENYWNDQIYLQKLENTNFTSLSETIGNRTKSQFDSSQHHKKGSAFALPFLYPEKTHFSRTRRVWIRSCPELTRIIRMWLTRYRYSRIIHAALAAPPSVGLRNFACAYFVPTLGLLSFPDLGWLRQEPFPERCWLWFNLYLM